MKCGRGEPLNQIILKKETEKKVNHKLSLFPQSETKTEIDHFLRAMWSPSADTSEMIRQSGLILINAEKHSAVDSVVQTSQTVSTAETALLYRLSVSVCSVNFLFTDFHVYTLIAFHCLKFYLWTSLKKLNQCWSWRNWWDLLRSGISAGFHHQRAHFSNMVSHPDSVPLHRQHLVWLLWIGLFCFRTWRQETEKTLDATGQISNQLETGNM